MSEICSQYNELSILVDISSFECCYLSIMCSKFTLPTKIEIPLLYIKEDPLPDAFPLGNGPIPFISAVKELSLSAILLIGSSETILLCTGVSTSSNNFRPIEIMDLLITILEILYFTFYVD